MKKQIIKGIIIIILSVILLYTLFIVEESIRLSNNSYAKPLIIFEESYDNSISDVTYESLGFTLKTRYLNFDEANDRNYPISQEFWLFDRFLIWAWIS